MEEKTRDELIETLEEAAKEEGLTVTDMPAEVKDRSKLMIGVGVAAGVGLMVAGSLAIKGAKKVGRVVKKKLHRPKKAEVEDIMDDWEDADFEEVETEVVDDQKEKSKKK